MDWEKRDSLYDFFRKVISLREAEELLRRGDFRTVLAERESRVFKYERFSDAKSIRIVINMEEGDILLSEEDLSDTILLEKGRDDLQLAPFGYLVSKRCRD